MNLSTMLENQICRSCTRIIKEAPQFLAENNKLTQLGETFQFCLFELTIDDNMPMSICHYCKFQLGFFCEFKKVAMNANQSYLKVIPGIKTDDIAMENSNDYDDVGNEEYTYVEYLEDEQNSVNILKTPNYKLENEDKVVIDTNDYDSVKHKYYEEIYLNPTELNEIKEDENDGIITFETIDYGIERRTISKNEKRYKLIPLRETQMLNNITTECLGATENHDDDDNSNDFFETDYLIQPIDETENGNISENAYDTKRTVIKEERQNRKYSAFTVCSIECDFCGIKLTSKKKYDTHISQHIKIPNKNIKNIIFECQDCGIEFLSKREYKVHKKEHVVRCPDCSKRFSSIDALTEHKQDKCTKPKYPCSTCSRVFKTVSSRLVHEYRHTNVRPYPCELCDKYFKTKSDLSIHIGVHRDIRKHVCEICGKAFRAYSHMNNHLETHTNNQYQCDVCNNFFKTKVSILQHLRTIHVNPNAYKCNLCNKSYGMKNRLKRHQEVSHKVLFEIEAIEEDVNSMYTLI